MHCKVHRPLRVLTCVANDLFVWKQSLVAHAGATFTIWNYQICSVLILRHCWRLHTPLGAATAAAEPGLEEVELEEEASPPASEEEAPITLP